MNNLDKMPGCQQYAENLHKVVMKFNISIDTARNLYGQYTIKEWNELLS